MQPPFAQEDVKEPSSCATADPGEGGAWPVRSNGVTRVQDLRQERGRWGDERYRLHRSLIGAVPCMSMSV